LCFFLLYGKFNHMVVERYLYKTIHADLKEKMVFLSGPRQVGKTTLAKTFLKNKKDSYFNWDNREDRQKILAARWPAESVTIVFDELHKYKYWKGWVKGEYDKHGERIRFLITGSARMDVYRKGGDSLQGRYHSHRLHGFSVGELLHTKTTIEPGTEINFSSRNNKDVIMSLFQYGPFPEPFLKQNQRTLRRWHSERMDRFFREDVRDLENVRDLSSMELLADMLKNRVGSPFSIQSLREDLEVSHKALSHWVDIFERLYFCFTITPFARSRIRSLKKIPKLYLWDWSSVPEPDARFENLVACHLLKMKHALEDQEGFDIGLHYLRDTSKREVDFLITYNNKPWFAVECRTTGGSVNPALFYFGERLNIPYLYQVNLEGKEDVYDGSVRVIPAGKFLSSLP